MKKSVSHIFLLPILLGGLAACTPTIENRGQMVDEDKVAAVQPGFSTREDVAMLLGSPTQVSTFDENVWYYFGRSTEQYSFFDPEVIEQKAIVVSFDDTGVVQTVDIQDPEAVKVVEPVSRRTPTYGRKMTVIEQIIGNVGRPATRNRK